MKILITGGSGQLGSELQRVLHSGTSEIGALPELYKESDVVTTDLKSFDITDENSATSRIIQGNFDLVINCAAMTDVDKCEVAQTAAFNVNAKAPGNLARACEKIGAKYVQISTDYVFSGNNPLPRKEGDAANPVSVYGRSKLAGEEQSIAECSRCFIVRSAWLYGYVGENFVKTMMRLGASRDSVTVVSDQYGNPTNATDLAHEILEIAATDDYGVYHCTNVGTCSWADFAEAIMEGAELDCTVIRCTSEEYAAANPFSAQRPAYSSLRNKHLEDSLGNKMRPWREALSAYLKRLSELEG